MTDNCRELLKTYWTNYSTMSRWSNFKKKHKRKTLEEIQRMFIKIPYIDQNGSIGIHSLGSCTTATTTPQMKFTRCNEEDMETTMNTVIDTNSNARYALNRAVYSVYCKVERDAMKKFGFVDDDAPKTAAEIIKRITDGDITVPDVDAQDYDADDYRYDEWRGIKWRKPSMKKDRDGFEKHMDTFNKEKSALELEITVLEPVEALKNFKKFESKWIH